MRQGYQVDNIGNEYWYDNDLLHREDGPAMICDSGTEYWYMHGKLHRLDGPAIDNTKRNKLMSVIGGKQIFVYAKSIWHVEGNRLDIECQEEFEQWLKFRVFI